MDVFQFQEGFRLLEMQRRGSVVLGFRVPVLDGDFRVRSLLALFCAFSFVAPL